MLPVVPEDWKSLGALQVLRLLLSTLSVSPASASSRVSPSSTGTHTEQKWEILSSPLLLTGTILHFIAQQIHRAGNTTWVSQIVD